MTDAREIIARAAWDAHRRGGNLYALWADRILEALNSAGFRIIGPDEIDGPTVEKCAEIALSHANQTDYDIEPEAAVAENVTAKSIAAAIRALKEKRT